MTYPVNTLDTAPEATKPILIAAQKGFGFLPNLLAVMSTAPALLEGYMTLSRIFDSSSLSPTERQIVLLAASRENGCAYCMSVHTAIAGMQKVSSEVVNAIRDDVTIPDSKLEALRAFAAEVTRTRGWPEDANSAAFLAAGYGPQQVLEVVLGVGLKTISNYTTHIAGTPLDAAFKPTEWSSAA
ncbi:MAG: carboxymuconolactone decarboxylase family protein [Pseudorhodobacter sp.]|nr:carboxymuconolactone decarboxylase family protein [Pseudorhodobacter sp.]